MSKTIILSSLLALGISGIGGIANADEGSINGGSEDVSNYDGLVRSETSDNYSTENSETFRAITRGKQGGGYWIRGTKNGYTISSYKHYSKPAKAYVINGRGVVVNGAWKQPGIFSTAKIKGKGKAYYTHR